MGEEQPEQSGEPPKAPCTLYVGNLKFETTDEVFRQAFEKFGEIKDCRIVKRRDGKSKGFGFVEFSTQEEAQKAISEMNGQELDGRALLVNISDPESGRRRRQERGEYRHGSNYGRRGYDRRDGYRDDDRRHDYGHRDYDRRRDDDRYDRRRYSRRYPDDR